MKGSILPLCVALIIIGIAAIVDAERGTGDEQFGHDLGPAHHLGVKDRLVERHRPSHVLRPDEVLEFVDVHGDPTLKRSLPMVKRP